MNPLLVILLLLGGPLIATAHEIPNDVVVQTILKPEGDTLNLLVRVPLEAMRDINFPQTGPGYLRISAAQQQLFDAATVWIAQEITVYENSEALDEWDIAAARLALPSNRAFESYASALAAVRAPPLADSEQLHRDQALLDVLIQYPIGSAASDFSIAPRFGRLGLRTTTVVRFLADDGTERLFRFSGDPGIVPLDPSWYYAFFRFIGSGIDHILDGIDHLLFIICLLIPFRRIRPLIVIVTSFTIAHSITLTAAAFGMVPNFLWFPPLIEMLIAASIVYMAIENIVGSQWQKRWIIAFAFGLVHGFGFSFALGEILQFSGDHLLTSLFAFNIGVEIGQVAVILLAVPVLNFVFKSVLTERMGTIILSALIAHTGWHWMSDRASALAQYSFEWPATDAAFLAGLVRWLMLLMLIGTVLWLMARVYTHFLGTDRSRLSQSTDSS